ncbi:hypothetical protein SSP35_21_00400 [Streptomyces sp. NBRC 110611]|uniref:hypothetical protein n=1 Tax=Streptomyces sp. NBRC 110611 TaxID=1621259 RepID=UPI0008565657|nr:hypothetical protein [Streptomyces sp. NBRC 110611]GAU70646.1 hypothetical protein SSP35_21_00400 [Streptomyces sp. NBRC 110611]
MTTPPPTRQPPVYPPYPYAYPDSAPQPQTRAPRARRAMVIGIVVALALLLAGGATWWWLAPDGDGPLADRPRVTDATSGLSYAIPKGWEHDAAKDKRLLSAFSSTITKKAGPGGSGGAVLAGRSRKPIPSSALQRQAEFAARSNAEFFFPDQAVRLEKSQPATIGGHSAHTVALAVQKKSKDRDAAYLKITLVTVDGDRTSFVLGVATAAPDAASRGDVGAVLESATVE